MEHTPCNLENQSIYKKYNYNKMFFSDCKTMFTNFWPGYVQVYPSYFSFKFVNIKVVTMIGVGYDLEHVWKDPEREFLEGFGHFKQS